MAVPIYVYVDVSRVRYLRFAWQAWHFVTCGRVLCRRLYDSNMAVGSFTGVVIFGRFTCQVPSFRVAGVALRDMWTCFVPPLVR